MSKYQAYPEYKDSEVEWLGNLPNSWYESSLKYLLSSVIAGGTPDSSNEIYWTESGNGTPWVSIADITKNTLITSTNKDVTNLGMLAKNLKLLPKGTILYSIFASLGKIAVANKPLVTNQAILGLTPNKKVNNNFLCFWLSQLESHLSLFSTSNTQDNLNAEKVGNLPVFVPSLNEQTQIAAFLDHETAKIDTLIEKQQQLIELLKEKRQAVISHAVTKGLNPDAPIKDSRVEWLGEVPEHWVVSKFSFLKKVLTDYTANGSFADLKANVQYLDEPSFARLVRLTDLRKDLQNDNGVWVDEKSYKYLKKSALFGGEFLLANVGAYAGLFYQMPFEKGPASLAPNMFMAKFDDSKVSRKFMAYVGQSSPVASQLKLSYSFFCTTKIE
ncbi:restriction endonuclease subunit S [Photobacterium damselae]|uniref:restriction endonuclease subunit S n=1 Tax=Photobacterium damselae TaxID=38293 RepID=UPI001EEE524B|nr:restriction endonuclease subunit S [Photobacterium damselae]UKA01664.1 restriction endonuclease subunit S [Photobacterium damselae subsp. damselae]